VLITALIAYFMEVYLLDMIPDAPTLIPTILGTALAFFIGFNNNQAYDRWWEGRKIWGMIVNLSRSWARQWLQYTSLTDSMSEDQLRKERMEAVHRQVAFVYALKESLRGKKPQKYRKFMNPEEKDRVEKETNIPNALLSEHARQLHGHYQSHGIDGFIFMEMNTTLRGICDEMGKCERIKNTVFPTTYNYYTRIFVFVFVIFEVWGTAQSIGAWAILTGTLIGYIFLTVQAIGLALLNPFDATAAGLPLDQITRNIEINLLEMEGAAVVPKPLVQKNQEFIT
jgi:putative membrane protein